MKELKEILLALVKGISPKQAFILLLALIIMAGGYFIIDRYLDHLEIRDYVSEIHRFDRRLNRLDSRVGLLQDILQNRVLTNPTEGE